MTFRDLCQPHPVCQGFKKVKDSKNCTTPEDTQWAAIKKVSFISVRYNKMLKTNSIQSCYLGTEILNYNSKVYKKAETGREGEKEGDKEAVKHFN